MIMSAASLGSKVGGGFASAIILLLCYQLDKKYPKIMADLKEREQHGEL